MVEMETQPQAHRHLPPVPLVPPAAALLSTASAVALAGMAPHAAHQELARWEIHTTLSAYKFFT